MNVQILMSTYNGEKYLCTQLDSIVNQSFNDIELLIRDDGSKDNTITIIHSYMKKYPWIYLYEGENYGVQKSFFDLINHANMNCDFFAFADQDDEWLPNKLSQAVKCLVKFPPEKPALYCSDKLIVDQDLKPLHTTVSRIVKHISFANALIQNICTGCTVVFNRELLIMLRLKTPEHAIMHDWWSYLLAVCYGNVFYDKRAFIRYRQHQNNTSGAIISRSGLLRYRLHELRKPRGEIYQQARELVDSYQLPPQNEEIVMKLLASEYSMSGKLKLLSDKRFNRQKKIDDLVYRLIVIFGKL